MNRFANLRLRGVATTIAFMIAAAGLGACTGAGGAGDIVIGALYPTQGTQRVGGSQELRGVRLAVDWVNRNGGIHGHNVRLVVETIARPEAVPDAMAALAARHVTVVIGSHGSAVSAIAATEATQRNMSFWETGAVGLLPNGVANGRNFFRLAPSGATLGRAAIDFVHSVLLPYRKVTSPLRYTVTYVDDPYGRAVGAGAIDAIRRAGLTLAAAIPYDANHLDAAAVARKVAAARTDVIFASAYVDDGVAVQRALAAQHVPLKVAIGTSSSYCMPAFAKLLGKAAVGLFASDKPDANHVRTAALAPKARAELAWAAAAYATQYDDAMSAPALSGFSNALVVLGSVLPAARSFSVGDIASAAHRVRLSANSLPNGSGFELAPDRASDAGDNRMAESVIWQWIAPVTSAVVWPKTYATHAIADLPLAA